MLFRRTCPSALWRGLRSVRGETHSRNSMKRPTFFGIVLLLLVQACSSVSGDLIRAQRLQYLRHEVLHLNFDGLKVVFVYQNTNSSAVSFDSVLAAYKFFIDGRKVASPQGLKTEFDQGPQITFEVPVDVQWSDDPSLLDFIVQKAKSGSHSAPFRMNAMLTYFLGRRSFDRTVSTSGTLPLPHPEQNIQYRIEL